MDIPARNPEVDATYAPLEIVQVDTRGVFAHGLGVGLSVVDPTEPSAAVNLTEALLISTN